MGYSDPGHDYFNSPAHDPPHFLDDRGRRIFAAIEMNLVEQARLDRQGNGTVIFRKDRFDAAIDAVIDIAQLAKAVQGELEGGRP